MATSEPWVHGVSPEETLDDLTRGRILIEELRCDACHRLDSERALPRLPAPDLRGVSNRLRLPWLRAFLSDPRSADASTRMPDGLVGLDEAQRERAVESLVHFLWSEEAPVDATRPSAIRGAGEELYHRVGCVACHAARRPPSRDAKGGAESDGSPFASGLDAREGLVALEHVPAKYSLEGLATFLFDPHAARPDGRMPDMRLGQQEAAEIASYLLGGSPDSEVRLTPIPERVEEGKALFGELGCANCHTLQAIPSKLSAPALTGPRSSGVGCHLEAVGGGIAFALTEDERRCIDVALSAPTALDEAGQVEVALHALRCTNCHERDGRGGAAPQLNPYFTTDDLALGDHGRLPPTLTLVGAKLRQAWLHKVLFEGARVRPYMHTRMPQFGEGGLGELPSRLAHVDRLPSVEPPRWEGEEAKLYRDAGRELLGDKGLACVTCHDFNGLAASAMRAVDLVDTCERLTPAWWRAFLIDPQRFRPGILMPESFPGGEAVHTGILDGDTDAQIAAMWFFLSDGRTARTPDGIAARPTKLAVEQRPRLYRGRSRVAGFRGIAVGFPGGVNYAFDANNGALAALWSGEFVSVRWDGQGAGDFDPLGRAVELARDLAFWERADEAADWPLRPRTSEERPVNPDPTYPRQHGYRFRGYDLEAEGVPTLRYSIGEVAIEDRSLAAEGGPHAGLERTLRIESPRPQRLWLRALVGEVAFQADGRYRAGRLWLQLPPGRAELRATRGGDRELLFALELPQGTSEWRLSYELQD